MGDMKTFKTFEFTFPSGSAYPRCAGKKIKMREPTTPEFKLATVSKEDDSSYIVAKQCIVEYDGQPVKDIHQDDVWDQLPGPAKSLLTIFVNHMVVPREADVTEFFRGFGEEAPAA